MPCGSRSTSSTHSPTAASAVARLMAVVVLPTPPFWLAIARMRGLRRRRVMGDVRLGGGTRAEIADPENAGLGRGLAGNAFSLHVPLGLPPRVNSSRTPRAFRNRQMPPGASSGAARSSNCGRGARARAVIRCAGSKAPLDSRAWTSDGGAGDARGLPQERGLALVGLDRGRTARRRRWPAPARESRRPIPDRSRGRAAAAAAGRSCRQSAIWRSHIIGTSRRAIRLTVRFQRSSSSAKRSSRPVFHVKQLQWLGLCFT